MSNSAQPRGPSSPSGIARGQGREAICRALPRVVARDGFDGVTFRSVAAEAGVTHGLVSYHFRTRESMIHDALKWAVEHTLEATHLAASTGRIDDFAADVSRALSESPEDAIFQFEVLLRALRSPDLREDVRKSYDDYVAAISDSLRAVGVEGEAIARLVFAALDGLTLQQLLYDDPRRTEETLSALREMLAAFAARHTGIDSALP
jgi:TetR/AcrR family transcriptional regulator, regulator of biofilm formation and stress response